MLEEFDVVGGMVGGVIFGTETTGGFGVVEGAALGVEGAGRFAGLPVKGRLAVSSNLTFFVAECIILFSMTACAAARRASSSYSSTPFSNSIASSCTSSTRELVAHWYWETVGSETCHIPTVARGCAPRFCS